MWSISNALRGDCCRSWSNTHRNILKRHLIRFLAWFIYLRLWWTRDIWSQAFSLCSKASSRTTYRIYIMTIIKCIFFIFIFWFEILSCGWFLSIIFLMEEISFAACQLCFLTQIYCHFLCVCSSCHQWWKWTMWADLLSIIRLCVRNTYQALYMQADDNKKSHIWIYNYLFDIIHVF